MMPFTPVALPPVALLVDGENMSKDFAEALLQEARAFGIPTVRRVYGKSEHISGWEDFGFRLVPTRPGKNAADMLLCVEAMSLALKEQFHTLLIASSDRDFSYVAEHLRELGHHVVGMGEKKKAPSAFRKSCSEFVELKSPASSIEKCQKKQHIPATKIVPWVRTALVGSKDLEQWACTGWIGHSLKSTHPDFKLADFGHKKLSELLDATGYFDKRDRDNGQIEWRDPFPKLTATPAPHTAP